MKKRTMVYLSFLHLTVAIYTFCTVHWFVIHRLLTGMMEPKKEESSAGI